MGFLEKQALGLRFGCVLVANGSNKADFQHVPEYLGRNIRTARVIAEIVGERFFPAVWSLETRFDRYLRNGESPQPNTYLIVCGRLASRRAPSNYHQGSGRLLVDPERKADTDCSLITGNPEVILRSARKVTF